MKKFFGNLGGLFSRGRFSKKWWKRDKDIPPDDAKRVRNCVIAAVILVVLWSAFGIFCLGYMANKYDSEPVYEFSGPDEHDYNSAYYYGDAYRGHLGPRDVATELDAYALVIYTVSGSDLCSDDTRMKVGNTAWCRTVDPRFPDNIFDVLTEYKQYGDFYLTGLEWPERAFTPEEGYAVERAYECAARILSGERVFETSDVVWSEDSPQGDEIVSCQDGLYFCR